MAAGLLVPEGADPEDRHVDVLHPRPGERLAKRSGVRYGFVSIRWVVIPGLKPHLLLLSMQCCFCSPRSGSETCGSPVDAILRAQGWTALGGRFGVVGPFGDPAVGEAAVEDAAWETGAVVDVIGGREVRPRKDGAAACRKSWVIPRRRCRPC